MGQQSSIATLHQKGLAKKKEVTNLLPWRKECAYIRLVEPENILLPPLHIKLGLIKKFGKLSRQKWGRLQISQKYFSKTE